MNNINQNKYKQEKRYNNSLRLLTNVLRHKIKQRSQILFYKIKQISLKKSNQYLQIKSKEIFKRLSKIFTFKLRLYWNALIINSQIMSIQNKQKQIDSLKVKDRVYDAKVKSLRVLSRQWKQKKSTNIYKNKYFTPKTQQTPKMLKQKNSQQIYVILRNLLRNKYLQVFNKLKYTQNIKFRNSKTLYLANYMINKRRYWLTYGLQKLKVNTIINRQQKNKQQIQHLDTKLVPVQDSQIQNIKQRQQKFLSSIQTITKQKQTIVQEIQKQISQTQSTLSSKKQQIKFLQSNKQLLLNNIQECKQKNNKFEFNKDQIYYLIYVNFIINLKLWSQFQALDNNNIFLNKAIALQWLQSPIIDLDLDKVYLKSQSQLNQITSTLSQTIANYQRLKSNTQIDFNQLFQYFFSSFSINQSPPNYQQFFNKIKLTSKMVNQVLKQNNQIINYMLHNIHNQYQKVQSQSFQILQN